MTKDQKLGLATGRLLWLVSAKCVSALRYMLFSQNKINDDDNDYDDDADDDDDDDDDDDEDDDDNDDGFMT